MSHSVDRNQQHLQKYLDLYQLRQSAVASTLHSNLAQPIVAAKSFAAAIISLQGDDVNLKEAQELAGTIFEMTDQAYTVAYDLMREIEFDVAANSGESMQSVIERFGMLLRLNERGIKLLVFEDVSSVSVDSFVQVVMLDWVKALLIYLSRHTKASDVVVRSVGNELGLKLEVTANVTLNSEQLETELVFVNICKQLEVLNGSLQINSHSKQKNNQQSCVSIVIPPDCGMLTLNNE